MADLMDEAIEISHKLIPCNICGRTFLPSPLKKHAKVCEKNATRKRKTFNSLKQRIEGTELAVFHQKSFLRKNNDNVTTTHAPQQPQQQQQQQLQQQQQQQQTQQQQQQQEEKRNQSKWKEKHEELVQAIRAAKGEKTMAPRRSISAVGSMGTTEQCPSCDRHFGPKAYDRHVEWCKEHKIRASKSPAIVTIAKERLEARTKYRVPPLTKSKRTATRDKYASPSGRCSQDGGGSGGGGGGSTGNLLNVRSTSNLEQRHTSSKKTKQKNSVPPAEPIIKHNAEKLKSSNFKYRVYPILKMNDTNINESVLDMTVSQMNLRMQSPNRPSPPQSQYKLITWKETPQPPQQQQSHNKQQHPPPPPQQQQVEQNVSTTTCLPFTINLVDSEQNVQNHNDMNMNIIEYETNSDGDDDLNEDDTNLLSVLPTIVEETESAQLLTIKEAISSSQMRDTDDDNDNDNNDNVNVNVENDIDEVCRPEPPEQPETESIEEFRSSTPVNRTDDPSIKIRNETVHSISFDISPVLKAPNDDDDIDDGIDDDDEPQIQNNTGEISEQEWQDLDDYYQDIKAKRKKRKHTKMLDKFLKDKSTTNCRLEVEIVANEPCDKRNKLDANNEKRHERNLNLYRVNSSEIVIRGERCIDALNKSFSRNKIKHVNIVFLNEETKRESEICLQTDDNDNDNDNDDNDNEYDDDDIYERRKKTCGARKLMKRERERGRERERERTRDREREREGDNFWAQYTNNKINNNNDNNKNNNKNKIKNKNNRDCSFNDDCDTTVMDLDDEDEVEDYYVVDDNVDDDEDDDDDDDLILPPINVKQRSSKLAKGDETFETFNKQRLRRERESPPSPPVGVRFPPIHEEKYQSREKEEYDPFIIAEKQLMELLEGDDFKPYKTPSPKNKIQLKSLPTTTTTTTTTTLPIFEDDNFEFLENFINDNYTTQAKHQRKFSDEINSIDPKLINANDNLKLPEPGQLAPDTDHYYSDVDHYSAQYDKSISILEPLILPKTEMKRSHSSQLTDFDEFISSAIDDDDDGLPTLKTYLAHDLTKQKKCSTVSSFGKGRNEHNAANKKHPLSPLKRNVTMPGGVLANPVVKARSMKNKQDIQDYLHVRHDQKLAAAVAPSRDKLKALSPRPQSSDDLFPIGHDMYNEYKKYEDMYRREQHDNMHDHENEDDEVSSNEEQHLVQQHKQKINADSAYNRKSPKQQQIAPKSRQKVPPPPPQPQLKRSPSSSGSEAANNNQNNQNTQNNQNQNKNNRLTKFCHECGTKYPLDSAKFCVECGIKRLVL